MRRRREAFSILMLDLDRFKNVNDSLGHAAGDALLRQVAKRLRSALRAADVLARLGGDEFAIIQAGCDRSARRRRSIWQRGSRKLIAEPFQLPGHRVEVGTSIGIAMAPEHGERPGATAEKSRPCALPVEIGGPQLLHALRRGDVGRTGSAQYAGGRFARCHRALPVRSALSAVLRRPDRPQARCRGAGALASSDARADPAGSVHSACRGDRADRAARRMGACGSACDDATSWPADIKVAVNLSPVQFKQAESVRCHRSRRCEIPDCRRSGWKSRSPNPCCWSARAENHAFMERLKQHRRSRWRSTISAPAIHR